MITMDVTMLCKKILKRNHVQIIEIQCFVLSDRTCNFAKYLNIGQVGDVFNYAVDVILRPPN